MVGREPRGEDEATVLRTRHRSPWTNTVARPAPGSAQAACCPDEECARPTASGAPSGASSRHTQPTSHSVHVAHALPSTPSPVSTTAESRSQSGHHPLKIIRASVCRFCCRPCRPPADTSSTPPATDIRGGADAVSRAAPPSAATPAPRAAPRAPRRAPAPPRPRTAERSEASAPRPARCAPRRPRAPPAAPRAAPSAPRRRAPSRAARPSRRARPSTPAECRP